SDAEAHAEEDKKFQELVEVRNKADQLIHATEGAIKEHGDKAGDAIGGIEEAVAELKKVKDGDDKAAIEAKTSALEQSAQALFAAAQQAGGNDQPGADSAGQDAPGGASQPDDVV